MVAPATTDLSSLMSQSNTTSQVGMASQAVNATVQTIGTIWTGIVQTEMMNNAYVHAETMAGKDKDDKVEQIGIQNTLVANLEGIHKKVVESEGKLVKAEGKQKIAEARLTEAKKNDAARNIDSSPLAALLLWQL